jgi:hypothetical protein
MKNATLPPLRVDSELRAAQREFVACGLLAREQARASGEYVGADEMLARLDASLVAVRSKQAANTR